MFVRVLYVFVISLASIKSLQNPENCVPGSQVCDSVNVEHSSSKTYVNRTSTLGIDENYYGFKLFLDPYIENGKFTEARNKSEVISDMFLGVKSYSGFLTVNKTYNSNLFFWYFPIENQTVSESNWIIWLQGSPHQRESATCLDGVFEQIGPFIAKDEYMPLERNPYSWHQKASLLFIDNPVGAGFSYTTHPHGYVGDIDLHTFYLKVAVSQLLQIFPELRTAPLFVAGESYGGKYAVALAAELHKAKMEELVINLKGVITGNGLIEGPMLPDISKTFYHSGLITPEQFKGMESLITELSDDIAKKKTWSATVNWRLANNYLTMFAHQKHSYSITNSKMKSAEFSWIVHQNEFRRAIHIGTTKFENESTLMSDFLAPVRPFYEELLNNKYHVTTYCGMLDLMLPCYLESEQHLKWQWSYSQEFIDANRKTHYDSNGTRVGYYTHAGYLTEIQYRKAGHFVSRDSPEVIYDYISTLTSPELTEEQEKELEQTRRKLYKKKKMDEIETPLILTPYLEVGQFEEAKNLSEVKSSMFLGVKSYSGFLTVNKTYNSNLFFWYFPIENQPISNSMWIIWLQGGRMLQGSSPCMDGVFEEVGPFIAQKKTMTLKRNPYSWHKIASLVFIDSLVGYGYSFADKSEGHKTDFATHMLHLKVAIGQLLQIFPELKLAPLMIAGESFGGKYAAAFALELHKARKEALYTNLQGVITGNTFLEASVLTQIPKTFHHYGLISIEDFTEIQPEIKEFAEEIKNNRGAAAAQKWNTILHNLLQKADQENAISFIFKRFRNRLYSPHLKRSEFKTAIHVANTDFFYSNWYVDASLENDFLISARPYFEELLNQNYIVTTYCGMLDLMLPCYLESEEHLKWQWNYSKEFVNASREIQYDLNLKRTGYFKSGGNLTEIQFHGAGHFVSSNNAKVLFDFVSLYNQPQLTPAEEKELEELRRRQLLMEAEEEDPGTPLMLTPYINEGKLTEARTLSRVDENMFLGVKSYSGFLTVNSTYNSNLFFWYFPTTSRYLKETVIWLQGGQRLHGSSSILDGVFEEVGPFTESMEHNRYSWHTKVSLVFIDNPVGSGYSFTDHRDGFVTDMDTYVLHLKLAIDQLMKLFPELREAPLLIAGESLSGKYAPALALKLHEAQKEGFKIKLQGVITGNSFLDASMLTQVPKTFYHYGLISKEGFTTIQPFVDDFAKLISNNQSVAAAREWYRILDSLLILSGQTNAYNILNDPIRNYKYNWISEKSHFKKAIHVGNTELSYRNTTVDIHLAHDFLTSAMPFYEKLLNLNYFVITYCGMLDLIFPCYLASEQHLKWKWQHSKEWAKEERSAVSFGTVSRYGYFQSNGNLTEVHFRKAGHYVARDLPELMYELAILLKRKMGTPEDEEELVKIWLLLEGLPRPSPSN